LQSPVEAFGFAVGPGAVRLDEPLDGAEVGHGLAERGGVAVGEGVICDDPFDPVDAVPGEVACGPGEEPGRGGAFFVGEDFGVAEAGVVIDGDVDVVVADPASLDLLRAAMGPPAASFRDASELLDVQMDQFPGPGRSYRLVVVLTARIGAPVSGSLSASRGAPYRCRIRAGTPVSAAIRRGPNLTLHRASRTICSRSELVRVGVDRGRLERSLSPACPSARKRLTHRYAVCRETPSYAAT
jgi:hypothetical protein